MPAPVHSVGVDLGGTWIRLEALDARGRRCRSLKAPAPDLKSLPRFLRKTFHTWKQQPRKLTVGSRGVWKAAQRAQLKRALKGLASEIQVMSDVEAAWHAAFGLKGTGVVVLAGTGSIALGKTATGRLQRAGGLGPASGDEGSAFWIGKMWRDKPQGVLTHKTIRRTAGLARQVFHKAQTGNIRAQSILRQAQHHLAQLAVEVAKRLHLRGTVPVSWGGSVLENAQFRLGFKTALKKTEYRFKLSSPKSTAAMAVAQL